MAQFNKNEQDFLNQERTLFEVNMIANKNGEVVTVDNPFPVSIGSTNITINGSVSIPGIITVTSSEQNPVHTHVTEVGTSDILTTPYLPVGVGTVNLNLTYLPVGISSLLNTVSVSNTSFYVTGVGATVDVRVTNPISIGNTLDVNVKNAISVTGIGSTVSVSVSNTSFYVSNNGSVVSSTNRFPVSIGDTTVPVSIGGTTIINTQVSSLPKTALTAFDELAVQQLTQLINADSLYTLSEYVLSPENSLDGATGIDSTDRLFYANSGIQTGGIANLRTARFAKYRPGMGINGRFTAMFSNPVSNSRQSAGFSNAEGGYYFGYVGNSTSFGIGHTYDGLAHIVTLTLTTNPNATQVATINLAGVGYTASVSAGTSYSAATEISNAFIGNAVWRADPIDNRVIFTSARALNYTLGTYSLTSTGNLAGTISTNTTGRIRQEVFVPQSNWNGVGLGTIFNPQNLNVYQISYRWLGAGVVRFFAEHPDTGDMVLVHTQKWASRYQIPHVPNPSFRLGYSASTTAALVSPVVVKGASMGVFVEGVLTSAKPSQSFVHNNATTRAKDIEWSLINLRNNWNQFYYSNTQEVQIENISVSFQGSDPTIVNIYLSKRGIMDTAHRFSPVTGTYLTADVNDALTVNTASVVDCPVAAFTVAPNGAIEYDLRPYRIVISPGQILSVTFTSTSQITRSACTVIWNPE